MAQAPNILLISVDQWRGDCLAYLGHPVVRTPNLDRLAAQSTSFTRHFSCSAPCGPGRTSLLTGLYPFNHRSVTNGTPLDARFTNLALELRKAGYAPRLYGYTDTSADPRTLPADDPRVRTFEGVMEGFDVGLNFNLGGMAQWLDLLAEHGIERPQREMDIYAHTQAGHNGFAAEPARFPAELSESALTTDRVLEDIRGQGGAPWCYHVVYLRPHPPLVAPEPYHAMFAPSDVDPPLPASTGRPEHPFLATWRAKHADFGYFDEWIDLGRMNEADHAAMRAVYYGLIAEVDAQIGRLLAGLEDVGEAGRTLVILTCDHGEMAGDHGLWGKGGYFDAAYHIPLLIRDPGRPSSAGRRIDAFTESVDVAPTVLDWLGLDIPDTWDGSSLVPFIDGASPRGWRTQAFWEFDFRDVETMGFETALGLAPDECVLNVIRGERWKYVHFPSLPPLLFDLQNDPDERFDRSGEAELAAVQMAMAQSVLSRRMLHAERTLTNTKLTENGPVTYRGPRQSTAGAR